MIELWNVIIPNAAEEEQGGGGVVGRNGVLGPSYTRSPVCILFSYFLQISRETRDPRVNEEQMAHPVQRYVLGFSSCEFTDCDRPIGDHFIAGFGLFLALSLAEIHTDLIQGPTRLI